MVSGTLGPLTAAEAVYSKMLWENFVPQMVASRLSELRHLHSIMIHIMMGSLCSVCAYSYPMSTDITIDIGYDPLGFLPGVVFGKQSLT